MIFFFDGSFFRFEVVLAIPANNPLFIDYILWALTRKGLIAHREESFDNKQTFLKVTGSFEALCFAATVLKLKKQVRRQVLECKVN